MVIQFYGINLSTPCRNVLMTLKALGLEFEENAIDITKGEQKTPEYLAINPRGKVPALKDGDYSLGESRAISTYLCNQYEKGDGKRLYPTDPKERGLVDQILYVNENMEEVILKYVNPREVIFGNGLPKEENIPQVKKALDLYELYLSKNIYMAGGHVTLADFYMMASLQLLSLPEYNDFKDYPKTVAWLDKMEALPYNDGNQKEGLEKFKGYYQAGLKKHAA